MHGVRIRGVPLDIYMYMYVPVPVVSSQRRLAKEDLWVSRLLNKWIVTVREK